MKKLFRYATDLGVATGIAFDKNGEMFVGDRSGTVYKVSGIGIPKPLPCLNHPFQPIIWHLIRRKTLSDRARTFEF